MLDTYPKRCIQLMVQLSVAGNYGIDGRGDIEFMTVLHWQYRLHD
jgi:hypothetical protein